MTKGNLALEKVTFRCLIDKSKKRIMWLRRSGPFLAISSTPSPNSKPEKGK